MTWHQVQVEVLKGRISEAHLALARILHFADCANAFNVERFFPRDSRGCHVGRCLRLKQWRRIHLLEKKFRTMLSARPASSAVEPRGGR